MKTRRRGGDTTPRDIIRAKQILAIQEARRREIDEFADRMGKSVRG